MTEEIERAVADFDRQTAGSPWSARGRREGQEMPRDFDDAVARAQQEDDAPDDIDALVRAYDIGYADALRRERGIDDSDEPGARTRRIDTITAERVEWLWPGRIPEHKVSLLVGDPGVGKSMVTLALAAAVSRGANWPIEGEGRAPLGDALIVSAEDDPGDTIRPRLEAAGADLERCHVLDGIDDVDDDGRVCRRPWTLHDLRALEHVLIRLAHTRLVVIDPISAFLAGVDSHRNADVRALLAPLGEIAARHRVAVVVVSHLTKGAGPAIYRTTGSLAFVAAARSAYVVTRDQDEPGRRLLAPVKANLAPDASGLAYRIVADDGSPRLEWESEPVEVSADDALAPEDEHHRERRTLREDACDWLRGRLADGPVRADELVRAAQAEGISARTLRRARADIGAVAEREQFGGAYRWRLPGSDGGQHAGHTPERPSGQHGGQHAGDRTPPRSDEGRGALAGQAGPPGASDRHDREGDDSEAQAGESGWEVET